MKLELARRIAFTLGALLIFRLGTYLPLPGITPDPRVTSATFSIFSLSILPYIAAAILIQLLSMVSSKLRALIRSGDAGRRRIRRYTIVLAVLMAAFQAFGIASGLQRVVPDLVEPGALFLLSTTVSLTGGLIFLIWLSEQITARGIGNGFAVLLFASVAAEMPGAVAAMIELMRQGQISPGSAALIVILWVALVGLVVFMELARRRVPVEFAARELGDRMLPTQSTNLSLKLNSAGLMPVVVAPWLYMMPLTIVGLAFDPNSPWLARIYGLITDVGLGRAILTAIAIAVFAFIYTASVVDPEHAADSLQRNGGAIPGIEPGEDTAEHLDRVVSYTTCIGAAYIAAIYLLPELLLRYGQVPFYLGGTSVLIVVCTVLDIETQVRGRTLTEPGGVYS